MLKKKPTEYLKQIYVDNIVFTPEAMRHLDAEIGYDRIMLGSDYPYPWEDHAVDVILAAPARPTRRRRRCWAAPPRDCSASRPDRGLLPR